MEPGSWVDRGTLHVPYGKPNYSRIGGSLFTGAGVPAAQPYLSLGSDEHGMYGMNVTVTTSTTPNNVTLRVTGSPRRLITDQYLANSTSRKTLNEGPFMYHPMGSNYWYLFYSRGLTHPDPKNGPDLQYRIEACRSTSPYGPWSNQHKPPHNSCLHPKVSGPGYLVLMSHDNVVGPGSCGVQEYDQQPFLYYEFTKANGNTNEKSYGLNRLDFSSGWPVVGK